MYLFLKKQLVWQVAPSKEQFHSITSYNIKLAIWFVFHHGLDIVFSIKKIKYTRFFNVFLYIKKYECKMKNLYTHLVK